MHCQFMVLTSFVSPYCAVCVLFLTEVVGLTFPVVVLEALVDFPKGKYNNLFN